MKQAGLDSHDPFLLVHKRDQSIRHPTSSITAGNDSPLVISIGTPLTPPSISTAGTLLWRERKKTNKKARLSYADCEQNNWANKTFLSCYYFYRSTNIRERERETLKERKYLIGRWDNLTREAVKLNKLHVSNKRSSIFITSSMKAGSDGVSMDGDWKKRGQVYQPKREREREWANEEVCLCVLMVGGRRRGRSRVPRTLALNGCLSSQLRLIKLCCWLTRRVKPHVSRLSHTTVASKSVLLFQTEQQLANDDGLVNPEALLI